jgi:cell division septal protein FtsQ
MPRRSTAEATPRPSRWARIRVAVRVLAIGFALGTALYAFQRVEAFLLRDARFIVVPPDYGLESPSIKVDGLRYASRAQILNVFKPDFGRSLYQVPLAERRERIRQLDWVKDASVARIWPDRLAVRIAERDPVAFIEIPYANGLSKLGLIDAEGIILQLPKQAAFKLPVALGVGPRDSIEERRERIHRMQRVIADLGQNAERVSEIDVADANNLKVTVRAENRAIALLLGDQDFGRRVQNFIDNYPRIQARVPNASTLDMRLDGRITVVEGKSE